MKYKNGGFVPSKGRSNVFSLITLISVCFIASLYSLHNFFLFSHDPNPEAGHEKPSKQDDFTPSSMRNWNSLPNKRLLVVQFVTNEKIDSFNQFWWSHENNFLLRTQNVSLLLAYPHFDYEFVKEGIIRKQSWIFKEAIQHDHPLVDGPLQRYETQTGVELFIQPIKVDLPRYYLQRPIIPHCANTDWSLTYSLYSGAVFSYHLPQLPFIEKYDYFLKVDTDIEFREDFPFDVGHKMEEEGCALAHSVVHPSSDCENESLTAILEAARLYNLPPPKSAKYEWCNDGMMNVKPKNILHANFVAFSVKLLLHPDILRISKYLFEEWPRGYFLHRWGDQAPFTMYPCYLLDIPDIFDDPQVCDFTSLRDTVFIHHS